MQGSNLGKNWKAISGNQFELNFKMTLKFKNEVRSCKSVYYDIYKWLTNKPS